MKMEKTNNFNIDRECSAETSQCRAKNTTELARLHAFSAHYDMQQSNQFFVFAFSLGRSINVNIISLFAQASDSVTEKFLAHFMTFLFFSADSQTAQNKRNNKVRMREKIYGNWMCSRFRNLCKTFQFSFFLFSRSSLYIYWQMLGV